MSAEAMYPDNVHARDGRKPVVWLNYNRNVIGAICTALADGTAMGPTMDAEPLWPVEAVFDPETGRTRVGFSYMPPADVVDADADERSGS